MKSPDPMAASVSYVRNICCLVPKYSRDRQGGAGGGDAFATFDGVNTVVTLSNGNLTVTHASSGANGGARSATLKSRARSTLR